MKIGHTPVRIDHEQLVILAMLISVPHANNKSRFIQKRKIDGLKVKKKKFQIWAGRALSARAAPARLSIEKKKREEQPAAGDVEKNRRPFFSYLFFFILSIYIYTPLFLFFKP